jgi:hypothetical protein
MQFTNDVVRYTGITKLIEIAVLVAEERNLNKPHVVELIEKGFKIYACLQALEYSQFLSRTQRERIWYCLTEVAGITDFPIAPVLGTVEQPAILFGGNTTIINNNTYQGGTPFINNDVDIGTETVDTFAISTGKGAVWFYTISNGTIQEGGIFQGSWLPSGLGSDYSDEGTVSIGGTVDVVLSMDISAGNVRLRATASSNNWIVDGTRFVY